MDKIYWLVFITFFIIATGCDEDSEETKTGKSFEGCIDPFEQNENLEVVTFNLEEFPKKLNTIINTAELLEHLNADVIALQEITNESALKELASQMKGWEYVFPSNSSDSLSLGFLIKMTEMELIEEETKTLIFPHLSDEKVAGYFVSNPFQIKIRHRQSGIEINLINLHLQSFEEDTFEEQGSAIGEILKYLEAFNDEENAIVLGDFGIELTNPIFEEDIADFTGEEGKYQFADMDIALGSEDYWSFPGQPGHVDHVLLSNEWAEHLDTTMTMRPDFCLEHYWEYISDHRPLVAVFKLF